KIIPRNSVPFPTTCAPPCSTTSSSSSAPRAPAKQVRRPGGVQQSEFAQRCLSDLDTPGAAYLRDPKHEHITDQRQPRNRASVRYPLECPRGKSACGNKTDE